MPRLGGTQTGTTKRQRLEGSTLMEKVRPPKDPGTLVDQEHIKRLKSITRYSTSRKNIIR
jgi:hypothetical protein